MLGWPYFDNDELLARAVGKDTRRVQEEDGVARVAPRRVGGARRGADRGRPLIAGVAGGVVTDPLDLDPAAAAAASWSGCAPTSRPSPPGRGTDRPWLGDSPAVAMSQLYAGREALYTEVATLIVDVDTTTPDQTADRIIAAMPDHHPHPG